MKAKLIEVWGWYGMLALLAAYALSSFGLISPHNFWYQFLNLTGAAGIVAEALSRGAYPPAVLNIVWGVVAAVALIRILLG